MSHFSSLVVYWSLQHCIDISCALTSLHSILSLQPYGGHQLLTSVTWQRLPLLSILGVFCLYFIGCPVEMSEPLTFICKHGSMRELFNIIPQSNPWQMGIRVGGYTSPLLSLGCSIPRHILRGSSKDPLRLRHNASSENCTLIRFSSFSVLFCHHSSFLDAHPKISYYLQVRSNLGLIVKAIWW